MQKLTRTDLMSLEKYDEARPEFRSRVLAHKRLRQVALGQHATLYFEDRLTIHYQIQEMLRIERIFDAAGIEDELNAYNPLIPDGSNLKATLMIEFTDIEERRTALAELVGIEADTYAEVEGFERVAAVADEDLDRATEAKTSAVHFLRFEFTPEMISALKSGAGLTLGIEHSSYREAVAVADAVRESLIADFD